MRSNTLHKELVLGVSEIKGFLSCVGGRIYRAWMLGMREGSWRKDSTSGGTLDRHEIC